MADLRTEPTGFKMIGLALSALVTYFITVLLPQSTTIQRSIVSLHHAYDYRISYSFVIYNYFLFRSSSFYRAYNVVFIGKYVFWLIDFSYI